MKKKSNQYWSDRFLEEEKRVNTDARLYARNIEKQYDNALKNIEKDINNWYNRVATNNNISLLEAQKMLNSKELKEFKWDVNEYIKKGQENAISQQWMKELENASARAHISRLDALKLQMQNEIEGLYGSRDKQMADYIARTYSDSYYHSVFEIQKGTGVGSSFAALDKRRVNTVINKPWAADGKNFSDRIWEDKIKLVNTLHNGLTQSFIRGESPDKLIANIAKEFDVKKSVAARLVNTESAAYASKAHEDGYKAIGLEKYEILATLDSKTSEICQEMDGKIIDMKDYQIGVTAPPFHPNCRTTTVPWYESLYDETRIARGTDGKNYKVPGDMTYKEWKKEYVDNDSKKEVVKEKIKIEKLENVMDETSYKEYTDLIESNDNEGIKELHSKYLNELGEIKENKTSKSEAYYSPKENKILFEYNTEKEIQGGMSKYSTLSHELGHFFDNEKFFNNLKYSEIDILNKKLNIGDKYKVFEKKPSSSDVFLKAMRDDKKHLEKVFRASKDDLLSTDASHGIQDAISGMFRKSRANGLVDWGHTDAYYDRLYDKKIKFFKLEKEIREIYKEIGFDVSNITKVKNITRDYETTSEIWANINNAVVCGGKELEYVEKYLPNSYKTFLEILKNVIKG